jgi:hypothetical protein
MRTFTRLNLQFPHPFRDFAWARRFLSGPSWNLDTTAGILTYSRTNPAAVEYLLAEDFLQGFQ